MPGPWDDYAPQAADTSSSGDAAGPWSDYSTPVKALAYGPVVGEYHHAAMFGPQGNPLGPKDVALSPNLLADNGGPYQFGQSVDARDAAGNFIGSYRVGDSSWFSPGRPTRDTIEFRDQDISHQHVNLSPSVDGPWNEFQGSTQEVAPAPQTATSTPAPSSDPIGDRLKLSEQVMADTQRNYPNRGDVPQPSPFDPNLNPDPDRQLTPHDIALQQGIQSYLQSRDAIGLLTQPLTENWRQPQPTAPTQRRPGFFREGAAPMEQGPVPDVSVPLQPGETSASSFQQAMSQPAVSIPPIPISPDDSERVKIEKTIGNVGRSFFSGATSLEGALGLMSPYIAGGQILASIPDTITKLREADKTPPFSPERHQAAAEIVANLLPFATHGLHEGAVSEAPATPETAGPRGIETTLPTFVSPSEGPAQVSPPTPAAPEVPASTSEQRVGAPSETPVTGSTTHPEVAATVPSAPETTLPAAPEQAPTEVAPPGEPPTAEPTPAETLPPGASEDVTGSSNRAMGLIYGEGDEGIIPGEGRPPKEILDQGRQDLAKGADPYEIATRARTQGSISPANYAILSAEHDRLVTERNAAWNKAEQTGDPQDRADYVEKDQTARDFAQNVLQEHKTGASELFRAFQTTRPIDYESLPGMRDEFRSRLAREMTPAEEPVYRKIANTVRDSARSADATTERAFSDAAKRFKRTPDISFEEANKMVDDEITRAVKDCIL